MDIPIGEALGFSSRGQEDKKMILPPQEGSVAATVCTFVSVSKGDTVPSGIPCTASPDGHAIE